MYVSHIVEHFNLCYKVEKVTSTVTGRVQKECVWLQESPGKVLPLKTSAGTTNNSESFHHVSAYCVLDARGSTQICFLVSSL